MKNAILPKGRPFANLLWILRPTLLVFSIYWLSRAAFMLKYPESGAGMAANDIPEFLFLSLRFDVSLYFSINILPLVLLILFGEKLWGRQAVKITFTLGNGLFALLNNIDHYFFGFNGRRTDWPSMRFLFEDAIRQIPQLLVHYPAVILSSIAVFFLIWKSFRPVQTGFSDHKSPLWSKITAFCIVLTSSIFFIRNSVDEKPLLPGNAFIIHPHMSGHAALNTGFVILKTLESAHLTKVSYLSEREMDSILTMAESQNPALKGRNLVLIILESFATEYTGLEKGGAGQTPFLDSLAGEGIYFPRHYASGRTSRDALPSILASVPPWMDESFSGSPYVSIPLEGLGSTLEAAGYQTAFFHGGKNGTMMFDLTSRICGFQRYYGMDEYPDSEDYDGNWGIFDQPFLQFTALEINKLKQPFGAGIFTLSSHQPYTLPESWHDTTGTSGQPVYKAIRYADYALKSFFSTAQRMPWFNNTLFVLTADHAHQIIKPEFQNYPGWYDVPLILFAPGTRLRQDTSMSLQHTDIRELSLDLLGLKNRKKNLLSHGLSHNSPFLPMQYQDGNYHVIHRDGLLIWDGKEPVAGWKWQAFAGKAEPSGLRKQTMARLQYYRNGLLDGMLFR